MDTDNPNFSPLLGEGDADQPLVWCHGRPVSRAEFLAHVIKLAGELPSARYAINLCDDRYAFMVAFAAALVAGQTNLLPHSRINAVVEGAAEQYPDSYCLVDTPIEGLGLPQHTLGEFEFTASTPQPSMPEIAAAHIAAITFTSGSTGQPQANPKTWGQLVAGAKLAKQRFSIDRNTRIIATVPPQHMYGLETSILLPLISGACVNAGRPFFPEDLRLALEDFPESADTKRVLITTPVHLRACIAAELQWPKLDFIISATAPLDETLARRIEEIFAAPLLEIFGCTEAGSIASRRTLDGPLWQPYDGMRIEIQNNQSVVCGAYLTQATAFSDHIEISADNRFRLLGRHADMVNIAGKRASLADLSHQLTHIPGVEDGIFFNPAKDEDNVTRLAAFVVAPQLDKQQILSALSQKIDSVFLPRPLHKLDALPRAATGKIPHAVLSQLYQRLRSAS